MKEWTKPELCDLNVGKTSANVGGKGNDQWIPDNIENFIEGYTGDIFGRRS